MVAIHLPLTLSPYIPPLIRSTEFSGGRGRERVKHEMLYNAIASNTNLM
ncbi:hypothetical protein [Fischerella thermalis]|nr:hypothetical protein [Fischerella thermalis]